MISTLKKTDETFTCGYCNNTSFMAIVGTVSDTTSEGSAEDGYTNWGDTYRVLKCPNCEKVNITTYFYHDSMPEDYGISEPVIYPQHKEFPVGLPEPILKSLVSAEKVKAIDAHGYAVLLGRTLELVCRDRGATSATLYPMLKELVAKGDIPDKLADVASGVRNFRNIGAHTGSGELSAAELSIVRSLLDAVLAYIYSAPHLAAQAEVKLNRIKRKRTTKA